MIPRVPLVLGLAGLLPFIAGAWISWVPLYDGSANSYPLSVASDGRAIFEQYGIIILCFMSGVLWGFATKSERVAPYVLSVLPALWVFFNAIGKTLDTLVALLIGFVGVFLLDVLYQRWGLTPTWWIKLRSLLTAIVCACLLIGMSA